MGIFEKIREAEADDRRREKEADENKLSGFELNVRRMEGLMMICSGDKNKALEIVNGWLDEAKRRYDRKQS